MMSNKTAISISLFSACVLAFTGTARAQAAETNKEALVVEMGAARARTQLAIQDLQKPLDFSLNGFLNAHNEIYAIYNKINAILAKAIAEEQARPVEMRNGVRIDNCTRTGQNIADQWADYGRKKTILDARAADATAAYQNLGTAFNQIAGYDIYWMRAGIDIKALTEAFKAIERRVLAIRSEAALIVAEQERNLAAWKAQLGSAEMMVMSK